MKKFEELDISKVDAALSAAYNILVRNLVDGFITVKFQKRINQSIFELLMGDLKKGASKDDVYESIANNEAMHDELWPLAEAAAENAFYAEKEDFVIHNVL